MNKMATLFEQAKNLLSQENRRKETGIIRPFTVEFTGSTNSGKSAVIDIIQRFFNAAKWRVSNPVEGAEIIKLVPRSHYFYNIRTAIHSLSHLLDLIYSVDYDLVIFDRCLYDTLAWWRFFLKTNLIPKKIAKTNQEFFIQSELLEKIDLCLFLNCEPEVAWKRMSQYAAHLIDRDERELSSRKNFVKDNFQLFQDAYRYFKQKKRPVYLIETSKYNPLEVALEAIRIMLDKFEKVDRFLPTEFVWKDGKPIPIIRSRSK